MENVEWSNEFDDLVKQIKKKREETKRKRDNPFGHMVMPMAMRVAAQTIGSDLVSVQPLSSPKISLAYLDYSYESEEDRLSRLKFEKRQRVIDSILGKTPEKVDEKEETIHLTIKDNNNGLATHKIMSQWASVIEKVTKDTTKQNWLNDYCKMHSSSGFGI